MSDYQTFVLPSNFSLDLDISRGGIKLSDAVNREVEEVWQREKLRRGEQLFNGKVLSLVEHNQKRLVARFVEYKYFLAYVMEPTLRKELGIHPLSLSCITRTSKAVLFGRRSLAVMQYPLYYELAPSGGIDQEAAVGEHLDVIGQALRELQEETGYTEKYIKSIKCIALVFEAISGIYEVIVEIWLEEDCEKRLMATPEYNELQWVTLQDLPEFVREHSENLVPMSKYILKFCKLLH